jgi:hypothetical protein
MIVVTRKSKHFSVYSYHNKSRDESGLHKIWSSDLLNQDLNKTASKMLIWINSDNFHPCKSLLIYIIDSISKLIEEL